MDIWWRINYRNGLLEIFIKIVGNLLKTNFHEQIAYVYNYINGFQDVATQASGVYSATSITDNIFIRTQVDLRRSNIIFSGNVVTSSNNFGVSLNSFSTGNPFYVSNNSNFNNSNINIIIFENSNFWHAVMKFDNIKLFSE